MCGIITGIEVNIIVTVISARIRQAILDSIEMTKRNSKCACMNRVFAAFVVIHIICSAEPCVQDKCMQMTIILEKVLGLIAS